MEYKEFAKYYDIFYQNKNYENEVSFLKKLIPINSKILDVGVGTGRHASILESYGYSVDGLDLNKEMLDIASTRLKGCLYNQNILNVNINKKYDVIISMFAVINHLNNKSELETALKNMKNLLNENGKIIIDLHNPQNSGEKTDTFNNIKRTMKWDFKASEKIEVSDIYFEIDNIIYKDKHIFRIFSIEDVRDACKSVGLELTKVFENYDINKEGNTTSKNLQFLIEEVDKDENNN